MRTIDLIIKNAELAGFKVYPSGFEIPKEPVQLHICTHNQAEYVKSWLYKDPICLKCEPYFNNTCGSCSAPRWRCAC